MTQTKHTPEIVARWMIRNEFATGHGITTKALLDELTWQVAEIREKNNSHERLLEALKGLEAAVTMYGTRSLKERHEAEAARAAIAEVEGKL